MTGLERLGREIAREQDALPSRERERAWVRARLLAWELRSRRPLSRARIGLAAAAALSVLLLGAVLFLRVHQTRPLAVAVGHSRLAASVGTWIHAPENEPLPLAFSDGTRIEMAPTTRARMLALEHDDARVLLESGRLRVQVAHRSGQQFSVAAGPFTVRVTGTRFDVSYNPERDAFELVLEEGQVELMGCVFGAGQKLVAGQRVQASCREQKLDVAYSSAKPPGAPSAAVAAADERASAAREPELPPASEKGAASSSAPSAAVPASKAEAAPSRVWLKLSRQGLYSEAFAAAEAEGFDAECARSSAAELLLLADTARHAGQLNRARTAFSTLRRRFPGAKEAGLAAFSLGLLEFDGAAAYAKSADWFRTYLRENPKGPLAREARGRLMEALHRLGNRAEASALAQAYLLDYPAGPHAELARRLVASP